MNKHALVQQLINQLGNSIQVAARESVKAAREVQDGVSAKESKQDARVKLEQGGLARGQQRRADNMRAQLTRLEHFSPPAKYKDNRIGLGSIVEIEDEDTGVGRTFFLAPVGAGLEITAPGGDGYFTVITPRSPIGQAAMGAGIGDALEVTVDGDTHYWEVTWVE
jgi:transcription elongation GreA/GreB family factor